MAPLGVLAEMTHDIGTPTRGGLLDVHDNVDAAFGIAVKQFAPR